MSSQPVKDWPSLIITTVTMATVAWWPHHHLVKHCTSCQHQVRPATADKVGTVACIVKETFCSPSKPQICVNINHQTVSNPNKTKKKKKKREREETDSGSNRDSKHHLDVSLKVNNNVSDSALHWSIYLPTHTQSEDVKNNWGMDWGWGEKQRGREKKCPWPAMPSPNPLPANVVLGVGGGGGGGGGST